VIAYANYAGGKWRVVGYTKKGNGSVIPCTCSLGGASVLK
jgi:hypothetical protein